MSSGRRVLWLSKETPDRYGQGGQRRQYFQIRSLVRAGHRVQVMTPRTSQDDQSVRALASVRRLSRAPRVHVLARRRRALRDALRHPSWDRVIVAHGESWELVEPWAEEIAAPVLVDLHNVMSRWYSRTGDSAKELFWRHLEVRIVAAAAVSACSRPELEALPAAGTQPRFVLAHGVDPDEWPAGAQPRASWRVVAFGNWWWHPNRLGLQWLCDEVWPEMLARHPGAILDVAGDGAAEILRGVPGTRSPGRVPDLRGFIAGASAVVVPVIEGAGVPVKFGEALASGAPVLATVDAGQAEPDAPALVSDDAAAWVEALVHYLSDPADARRRGEEARAYALERLPWQRVCEPLLTWVEAEGAQ